MNRHYVYVHRRRSDRSIFYVGKGSHPDRAYEFTSRNKLWQDVVAEHGVVVEIVCRFETDKLSQQCERDLIAWYGRENLTNLTDGGDGCAGIIVSAEARAKLSEHAKRPRSDAWVKSMRKARANGGNGGVVNPGDKLPDWWRERISSAMAGEKNHMHGRTGDSHPRSRPVFLAGYNMIFSSVTDAARFFGISVGLMHNQLTGVNKARAQVEFL